MDCLLDDEDGCDAVFITAVEGPCRYLLTETTNTVNKAWWDRTNSLYEYKARADQLESAF